jgi:hypothetical protein
MMNRKKGEGDTEFGLGLFSVTMTIKVIYTASIAASCPREAEELDVVGFIIH